MSFRREKFIPFGGPDGGDGGRGGDVVLIADRSNNTLLEFRQRRRIAAGDGRPGSGARRTGADGADVLVRVPSGTLVLDADAPDSEEPLADLAVDGQRFVAARGGRGGAGNARFATATRQAPDFAKPGGACETRTLRLALKLLADVGLVGLPNAGKSTLLRRISAARPRVAAYPFTTLVPSLGVVEVDERRFVAADIPGLIEGASEGVGLGDRFLRHIERTRVLVHVLDAGSTLLEGAPPRRLLDDYETIRQELGRYQPALLERRELVVLGKLDLVEDRTPLDAVAEALAQRAGRVHRISSATGEGIPALLYDCVGALDEALAAEAEGADLADPGDARA